MSKQLIHKAFFIALLFGVFFLSAPKAQAQSEVINNVKAAMKMGSSKELTKYFNERVDLIIDGERMNYSKVQAEFVLKDFFRNYPPEDFQYIHQGASKEGLNYTIGTYTYSGGSFRVLIRFKEFEEEGYQVYAISFDKEKM
jgi:hypothetical protein